MYFICNYQTTEEQGTHWIAMYRGEAKSFYFDSYGLQLFPEALDFLEEGIFSTFKIQPDNSRLCGQLSLWILFQLHMGKDFYDSVLELMTYFDTL